MDKDEASDVAEGALAQRRLLPYSSLVDHYCGKSESYEVIGDSGGRYQVEVQGFWDRGRPGDLRIMASVDDGGVRAFAPLTRDFIIASDGSFVGDRDLNLVELVRQALQEQELERLPGGDDVSNSALWILIQTTSVTTFHAAADLCRSNRQDERVLGARILRELGVPSQPHGPAQLPFAAESLEVLTRMLLAEDDPEVVVWGVAALGAQHRPEALPTIQSFAEHPDPEVRYAVAGAITAASVPRLNEAALTYLLTLAGDRDADVRFSAIFELAAWLGDGATDPRVLELLHDHEHDDDTRVTMTIAEALHGPRAT